MSRRRRELQQILQLEEQLEAVESGLDPLKSHAATFEDSAPGDYSPPRCPSQQRQEPAGLLELAVPPPSAPPSSLAAPSPSAALAPLGLLAGEALVGRPLEDGGDGAGRETDPELGAAQPFSAVSASSSSSLVPTASFEGLLQSFSRLLSDDAVGEPATLLLYTLLHSCGRGSSAPTPSPASPLTAAAASVAAEEEDAPAAASGWSPMAPWREMVDEELGRLGSNSLVWPVAVEALEDGRLQGSLASSNGSSAATPLMPTGL